MEPNFRSPDHEANIQEDFVATRSRWMSLQEYFVDVAQKFVSRAKLSSENQDDIVPLESTLEQLQDIAKQTHEVPCDTEFSKLMPVQGVATLKDQNESLHPANPVDIGGSIATTVPQDSSEFTGTGNPPDISEPGAKKIPPDIIEPMATTISSHDEEHAARPDLSLAAEHVTTPGPSHTGELVTILGSSRIVEPPTALSPTPTVEHAAETCVDIEDVIDTPRTKESNPPAEDPNLNVNLLELADLYYEHASRVRYLSDELINLGPPPVQSGADVEVDSEALTVFEHAQRHLELLSEINEERAHAAKYKQLCLDHQIVLDGDDDADDDAQSDLETDSLSEDVYRSLLSDREYGAPRIDSLVTVQRGKRTATTMASPDPGLMHDSRIMEWQAGLGHGTDVPLITLNEETEALAQDDDGDIEAKIREHHFRSRRPTRRLSTSAMSDAMSDHSGPERERNLPSFHSRGSSWDLVSTTANMHIF
jgi:hypothetical protein